jgi:hypothetical protein
MVASLPPDRLLNGYQKGGRLKEVGAKPKVFRPVLSERNQR